MKSPAQDHPKGPLAAGGRITGARCFRPTVRLCGAMCSWRKHFAKGCTREVIGYMEKLAAMDKERFAWPSVGTIASHAMAWHDEEGFRSERPFSKRNVQRSLRLLEQIGVLRPVERVRNRRARRGWVVAFHSATGDRSCTLNLDELSPPSVTLLPIEVSPFASRSVTPNGAEVSPPGTHQSSANEQVESSDDEILPAPSLLKENPLKHEPILNPLGGTENRAVESASFRVESLSKKHTNGVGEEWDSIGLKSPIGHPSVQIAWKNFFFGHQGETIAERAAGFLSWLRKFELTVQAGPRFLSALQRAAKGDAQL